MTDTDEESSDSSQDSLGAYIKKIRGIPLLSRQEEIDLARRIRSGDEEALQALVLHNLKYVVHVANRYKGCGLHLMDLINEGNIGLIQAAKRFDPDRGVKFITYAVWWIRQAITHALASQASTVRLPVKQVNLMQKIKISRRDLQKDLCRQPSTDELAEVMGLSSDLVESVLRAYRTQLPLDAPIKEGEDSCYLDLMEDTGAVPVEDQIVRRALAREVRDLLNKLTPREEKILRMRFGFDGEPRTLEEIGRRLNLSRERIRQIEKRAKSRLKAQIRLKAFAQ